MMPSEVRQMRNSDSASCKCGSGISRYQCDDCGDDLPKMLVDGPIAGEGTEYAPVRLCGSCKGKQVVGR